MKGACGGEESVIDNSLGAGMWSGIAGVTISGLAGNRFTGNYGFITSRGAAAGTAPGGDGPNTSWGMWSYWSKPWPGNNGTFHEEFLLASDGAGQQRIAGWKKNGTAYSLVLFSEAINGVILAESTNTCAFNTGVMVKWEFDNGVWNLWSDIGTPGTIALEINAYDDSAVFGTTMTNGPLMDLASRTNESKGTSGPIFDDCLFWDDTGDNWNSRIAMADFPRISAAHMPDGTDDSEGGIYDAEIDEVPAEARFDSSNASATPTFTATTMTDTQEGWGVDAMIGKVVHAQSTGGAESMLITSNTADTLTGTAGWKGTGGTPTNGNAWVMTETAKNAAEVTGYWATYPSLDTACPIEGGTVDLTTQFIQALMITHGAVYSPSSVSLSVYNIYEGGVLYADSEDAVVQIGATSASIPTFANYAGYFPWTPGAEANWTPTNFAACHYGSNLNPYYRTDQQTVQVIFFGSAFEWTAPAASTFKPRVICF